MTKVLLENDVLDSNFEAICRATDSLCREYGTFCNHSKFGKSFRYFLLFSSDTVLQNAGLGEINGVGRLYNEYFWFTRFMHEHGSDTGLEQQAFKILEQFPTDADWVLLEEIARDHGIIT